jgi:hypothetical protein
MSVPMVAMSLLFYTLTNSSWLGAGPRIDEPITELSNGPEIHEHYIKGLGVFEVTDGWGGGVGIWRVREMILGQTS